MADARTLITQMLRFMLIILLPLNALVFATSEQVIAYLFGDTYQPAASSFRILFAGISLYTLFMYLVSTISVQNRPVKSLCLSLALVPVAIVLNLILIPRFGIEGAAAAITTISAVGVFMVWPIIQRQFGRLVNYKSLLRIVILSIIVYGLASIDAVFHVDLLIRFTVLGALYVAGLFFVGEVTPDMLRGAMPIRKNTSESAETEDM